MKKSTLRLTTLSLCSIMLAACGSTAPQAGTTSVKDDTLASLKAQLQQNSVAIDPALVDAVSAEKMLGQLSGQAVSNPQVTRIPLQDPLGLPYGQLTSVDTQVANVITGEGLSREATITISGSQSVRPAVTMIDASGELLFKMHRTIQAMGQIPTGYVTVDGSTVFIKDTQGRFWSIGDTAPLSPENQQAVIRIYTELANEILNDPNAVQQLNAVWDAEMETSADEMDLVTAQSTSLYLQYVKNGAFDFKKFFGSQLNAQGLEAQTNIRYFPPYSFAWMGGEQHSSIWEGSVVNYSYPFTGDLTNINKTQQPVIGCAPAALGSVLHALQNQDGWTINGATNQTANDARKFMYEKMADGRPRMTQYMGGKWLNNGVMVYPGGFESGTTKFLQQHVRRQDGTTPTWVGGSRKYTATNDADLIRAVETAQLKSKPIVMGYWYDKFFEGGHYTPVRAAYVEPDSNWAMSWHNVWGTPLEEPDRYYMVSHRWSAFGGLWTVY